MNVITKLAHHPPTVSFIYHLHRYLMYWLFYAIIRLNNGFSGSIADLMFNTLIALASTSFILYLLITLINRKASVRENYRLTFGLMLLTILVFELLAW